FNGTSRQWRTRQRRQGYRHYAAIHAGTGVGSSSSYGTASCREHAGTQAPDADGQRCCDCSSWWVRHAGRTVRDHYAKATGDLLNPIVLVNTRRFFDPCLALLERCVEERFMNHQHLQMWQVVDRAEDVLQAITRSAQWTEKARAFAAVSPQPTLR